MYLNAETNYVPKSRKGSQGPCWCNSAWSKVIDLKGQWSTVSCMPSRATACKAPGAPFIRPSPLDCVVAMAHGNMKNRVRY